MMKPHFKSLAIKKKNLGDSFTENVEFEPKHFLRCHSKNNDCSDVQTQSNREQWKQEEATRNMIISSEEKWLRLFRHFRENQIEAPNLIKIVEYAFCLPGTSAPAERIFSLMNNAWTDDRGLMKESTVKGLMTCKINIGLTCEDFYNKIKTRKDFLKQVLANEKYM